MIRLENLGLSRKRLEQWDLRIEVSLRLDENWVDRVSDSFFRRYAAESIEEAVAKLTNTILPVHYRVFAKRALPPYRVDVEESLWRSPREFEPIPRGNIGHRFPWVSVRDNTIFEIYRNLYRPLHYVLLGGQKHVRQIILRAGGETPERAIANYHLIAKDLRPLVREHQAGWPEEQRGT